MARNHKVPHMVTEPAIAAALDLLDEMVFAIDETDQLVFLNAAGRRTLQLPLVGGPAPCWMALVHPEDRGRTLAAFQQCARSGEPVSLTSRLVTPGGPLRLDQRVRSAVTPGGWPAPIAGIARIASASPSDSPTDLARSAIFSPVHDLGNALATVLAGLSLLADGVGREDSVLTAARREAERAVEIGKEIARIVRGELPRPRVPAEQPSRPRPAVVMPPTRAHGHSPATGTTIMIVDDEPMLCAMAQTVLAGHGYRVLTARSGHEALAAVRGGLRADLYLVDLTMPTMSGLAVARELERLAPGARVLLSSGHLAGTRSDPSQPASIVGYLGKPYQHADLLDAVSAALAADSDRAEASA